MAKTLANYDPLVQIPSGMTPAGADFPIVESHDILVGENDKRLDAKLDDIDSAIGNVGQTPIATQLSSKVNTGDIVTSVAATGSTSNNKIPSETAVRAAIEAKTINVDSTVTEGSTNAVSGGAVHTQLATKQDKLTFDTTPTASSSNPVTSGGVKTALDAKQDTLTFDTAPTASSSNPVTSGGVKAALDTKQNTLTYETTPIAGSVNPVTSTGIRNAIDAAAASNLGDMQARYAEFVADADAILDRASSLSNGMVACSNIAAETTVGDTRILLYTGTTNANYTNGHWYYNSAASNAAPSWTDGGAVGSAPTIDNTLTVEGAAADSKSVGDAIENIVTISNTQPGANSGNKVWIKETTDEEVQIPTYEEHISKANKADIATNNESDNGSGTITASKAYAIGDHFYINNTNTSSENYGVSVLYKATAAITSGSAIVVGTNCEASKVADEITSLSNDIDTVKADLLQFTSITPIAWTHGAYVALSNSTADPSNPTSNASWMYAVVPCVEDDVFYINSNGGVSPRAWGFLDSSNNVLSRATGSVNVTNTVLKAPKDSVCLVLNNNDVSVSRNYVSYKGAPVAGVVSFIESDINDIKSELPPVFTALYNDNRIIYTTGSARHTWTGGSNGSITFHVGSYLVTRLSKDNGNKAWADISTSISDSIVIDGDEADITITANHSLVYNTTDKQLKIRALGTSDANHIDDILLISVAWAVPISGLLYGEYISRLAQDTSDAGNVSADVVRAQSFNSAFHTGATDFVTKCQQFSALLLGDTVNSVDAPTDFETFLFFTDPHLVDGSNWQKQCYEFVAQIQKYYNSTPTNFCLVGGDWLGTGDIPTVACYKMGYIDGFMRSMFDNCYMLVGNHDTNYQGRKDSESAIYTTRLSNQSIVDLWYRRKDNKAYYTFDGVRTRFYCFDTGTEAQTMDAYNNYGWAQADWFANALLTDNSAHIAVTMHILYHSYDSSDLSSGVQALSTWVLKIAQAYNARTTITVNDTSYDYTNATGKVEFCIAGHTHFDANGMLYDIPWVISNNVRHDVSKGATFDLCFVDYDNAKMTMVRVGDGSDRIISLATGGIVN